MTDVLGDIDELIVEAEKAMKDEQEKAQPVAEVEPVQQQIKVNKSSCLVIYHFEMCTPLSIGLITTVVSDSVTIQLLVSFS